MKNTLFTMLLLSLFSLQLNAQKGDEEKCTNCKNNKVEYEKYASALGVSNISIGYESFASGKENQAKGNYSHAFGEGNLAKGIRSFAAGLWCNALAGSSFALGQFLVAASTNSFVIGKGYGSGTGEYLSNSIPNSLMIGFNSTKPTFFVSESPAFGKTGRIGIGNITEPKVKLHIMADGGEDAEIRLEAPGTGYYGKISFGDDTRLIYSKPGTPLTFKSDNTNGFFFENGYVGIGTDTPQSLLDVSGTFNATGAATFGSNVDVAGNINFNGSLLQNGQPFETSKWDENGNKIYYNGGNVGIGINDPQYKLDIAGTLRVYDKIEGNTNSSFPRVDIRGSDDLNSAKIEIWKGQQPDERGIKLITKSGGAISFFTNSVRRMIIRDDEIVIGRPEIQNHIDIKVNGHILTREVEVTPGGGMKYLIKIINLPVYPNWKSL